MLKPVLGSQLQLGHPLANSLVGCWLFNEGSGKTVLDLSGNRNGTLTGTTWMGGDLSFDGGDYVATDKRISAITKAVEYTVIIKCTPSNLSQFILAQTRNSTDRFSLITYSTWEIRAGHYNGTSYNNASGVILDTTKPVTIAVVQYVDDSRKLYLNGILQSGANPTLSPGSSGNDAFYIGAKSDGTPNYVGRIPFLLIYNRALFPQEVASLYIEPFQMFEEEI